LNLKLLFLFAFLVSFSFATSGNGTIQDCQTNGWDYCNIDTNSTITGTDFSISNMGVNISAGVVITMDYSRLNITTTEYITVLGMINGSGKNGNNTNTTRYDGGNGGSGGGSCYANLCSFNGATNGSNGTNGTGGAGHVGNGSGVMPFEYVPEAGGMSHDTGGGFYASGYCYVYHDGGWYATAGGAGSGQAIYLRSSGTINMSGQVISNGGKPVALMYDAGYCGGSGGGEIILRANYIYFTGNLTAGGSSGAYPSVAGNSGGNGGRIRLCSATQPYVAGLMNVSGGTALINGTNGTIENCYTTPEWNVTFNCTDEMNNHTKNFTATIILLGGQTLISTAVNTYSVVPSTLWNFTTIALEHPVGIYMLGWNGTTRYYIAASTGTYGIRGYSLNQTLGSYYSFQVKNSLGAVVPNVQVSAYRYDTDLDAYAVIEQSITDSGGMATFYLQPLVPYQMVFIASGYVTMTYNFLPSTTSQIAIVLNPGGTNGTNGTNGSNTTLPQPMPNYQFAYGDVSFNVEPSAGTYTNDTNVTYTVASAGGLLEYWGMTVTYVNGTNTTSVYTNNLTTTSGGTMNYTASAYGTYIVSVWFKEQNFSLYTPFPTSFNIINATDNSFFNTRQHFVTTHVVSDWVFYFIAVVISMLVAGFVSRYTYEGAAWVGLLVLWGFTIFMTPTLIPASGVIYTALMGGAGGTSIQITAWMATSLATIGVLATTYLMKAGL
jgi:hypothetical protein